ncbi:MAG: membrane protein insertase YidC [Terricaulis sp.]
MQNRPGPNENRNLIIAVLLSAAIFFGFEFFYNAPMRAKMEAQQRAHAAQVQAQQAAQPGANPQSASAAPAAPQTPAQVLAASAAQRVTIDTPAVDGSISLTGARFDNLNLRQYRTTVDPKSPEVTLLVPQDTQRSYDAFWGWENKFPANDAQGACTARCGVGADQVWRVQSGERLTPTTPLVLAYDSADGFHVERTLSIDQNYMITSVDVVHNTSAAPITVRPYGVVRRLANKVDWNNRGIVHEGYVGAFGERNALRAETHTKGEEHARDIDAGKIARGTHIFDADGTGGWLGLTDHYWLAALIPAQNEAISGYYDSHSVGDEIDYRTAYRGQYREIAPGASASYTQHFFAGAKRVDLLQSYQHGLSIPRFDEAVDWGNLSWPLTRPFFGFLLHPLATWLASLGVAYNFGVAILLSTIVIKLLLFPLVYSSFKSMAKMRAIAPKQKEIQERYAADPQKAQQEILKLYQAEKANPVAGCLPIFLQIPVFFALYKTLNVTIEMRHAPFFGWVHDLSAPDPSTIFNPFNLLPYDPHTVPIIGGLLGIGVWPILYGLSMYALQGLSPPPPDKTQAQIFRFMPLVFTFMFAAFPAGLVIYWTWSNTLSILQQYAIMRRQGVETQFDKWITRLREKPAPAAE